MPHSSKSEQHLEEKVMNAKNNADGFLTNLKKVNKKKAEDLLNNSGTRVVSNVFHTQNALNDVRERKQREHNNPGARLPRFDRIFYLMLPFVPGGIYFGAMLADKLSGTPGWGALGGAAIGTITAILGSRLQR